MHIHYKNFAPDFDEWIHRKSDRITVYDKSLKSIPQFQNGVPKPTKQFTIPGKCNEGMNKENFNNQNDQRTRQILEFSDHYSNYITSLSEHNLQVVKVAGDGNCLFRSVAHQLYGDDSYHDVVRAKCMDYMEVNASFFSQFVIDGMTRFGEYLHAKRTLGTWGDDPEIQAMCELYRRPAEIWAYDVKLGAKKLRTFHDASAGSGTAPLKLSYYGGGHYDSVVNVDRGTKGGNYERRRAMSAMLLRVPGQWEDIAIAEARRRLEISGSDADAEMERVRLSSMSEAEQAERNAVDLAIQASRNDVAMWGDDDVEACLLLSCRDMDVDEHVHVHVPPSALASLSGWEEEKGGDREGDHAALALALARGEDVEIAHQQRQMMKMVSDESENDFLDQQIQQSVLSESLKSSQPMMVMAVANDDGIDATALKQLQQPHVTLVTQQTYPSNSEVNDPNDNDEDRDMKLALQLSSQMCDEDMLLQHTLQQSLTSTGVPAFLEPQNQSYVGTQIRYREDDDEHLQQALRMSMMNSNGRHGAGDFVIDDYDLNLAIQASLRHK